MTPKFQKIYFLITLTIISSFFSLWAQEEVIYSDNIYAKVDSVYPSNEVIQIADFSNFDVETGDIIMIYQVKGATHINPIVFNDSKPNTEYVDYSNNAGKYEFFIIAEIDFGNKLITTTRPLLSDYDNGEIIQLIKASFYFGDAVINEDINVAPWDPVKGYGGVFPIIGYQKLTLNADIFADGAGFKGGALDTNNVERVCNVEGEKFYLNTETNKAANKGEGYVTHRLSWTRGPGYIGNGGGGGVGKYSGGAGGGNWGRGGQSGSQVSACSSPEFNENGGVVKRGPGADFYNLDNPDASNRILFGGGGGAGIGDNDLPGKPWATGGTDGGGIIIILCDTLVSNSSKLSAIGESVGGVAEAGGGGAGAGGTILVDSREILGNLTIDLAGGNGGDVNNSLICPGAGGGGGGGMLWHSWKTIPSNIQLNVSGGAEGNQTTDCIYNIGWYGYPGTELGSLRVPLNGFFFNKIRGSDEICGGQKPDTIRGTVPKGGNGDFDYKWEYSQDSLTWSEYPAKLSDSINFQPDILYDTTYFRRLVTYNAITDTSLPVRIDVWPIIEDNLTQTSDQIICELDYGGTIIASKPRGGDGNFSFYWEKSVNLAEWEIIQDDTTLISIIPGQLDTTTYYRRFIKSVVVCQDYSDTLKITVQPGLENYGVLGDIQSCQGYDADTLTGLANLTGGDMVNYYYTWQIKGESGDWSDFGNDTTISYLLPGVLSDTSFFRRITKSGQCIDTSNTVKIEVLAPISNNIVFGDNKICYGDEALEITNNGEVGGGNLIDYNFFWEVSLAPNNWALDTVQHSEIFFPGILYDTTLFRRIVNSSVCWDTSDYVTIQVVPEIINKLKSPDTTICYGFYPNLFNEDESSGGNGFYSYQWKYKQNGEFVNATGNSSDYTYQASALFDTTLFYRIVESDICSKNSDTIKITVLPSITNNLVDESPISYTCYEIPKFLIGREPSGGDNNYLYQWEKSVDSVSWVVVENDLGKDFLTPELRDSIYYRRLVFSGDYKQCRDTSENLLLRIHSLPIGNISNLDTVVCDGAPVPFNYSFTGQSPWKIYFSDQSNYIVNNADSVVFKEFVDSDRSSQYDISIDSLRDGNNCKATELSGLIRVISYEVPSSNIVVAADVCGESTVVRATEPKFVAYWYGENLSFADSVNNESEVHSSVFDSSMMVIWHEQNYFCINEDTAKIVFFKKPRIETNFQDTFVYNKSYYSRVTPEPEYDSVTWIAIGVFDITESSATSVKLEGLEFGFDYQLVYRIDNGVCYVADTLGLSVSRISIPNVFTPNGDNINDLFFIEGLEEEGECILTIVNQWGNIVFHSKHTYNADADEIDLFWDGKDINTNEDVPEGTYYYILEPEKSAVRKGYVIIKRKGANGG